jgi:CDP-4-dehydro-6-deoxyglucose reductase
MPLPLPFEARLRSARTLTPSVRELTFERTDGRPMEFEPGQWVNALLPLARDPVRPIVKRSYSISSPPDDSVQFEVAVTRVQGGPGSTWLHALEPGTVLPFTGPQGFFTRPVSNASPSLMVATGTGVTPIRSMIKAAIAYGSRQPMWLLLGVRHEADLLYEEEFRSLAQQHSFFRFEPTLSQARSDWNGRRGYVQTHVRALWEELHQSCGDAPHAYVCGLEKMVGSVRTLFKSDLGLPRERVHSERYD